MSINDETPAIRHMASVGALFSALAHDIRNPINVITTSTYFVQNKLVDADPRLVRHLELIGSACKTATSVLKDFVDYAAMPPPAPALQTVIPAIRQAIAQLATGQSRLRFNPHVEEPDARIDPDFVTLAVRKLIQRALDRSPGDSEVHLGAGIAGDGVEITVEDSGPPVPRPQREAFFQPQGATAGARLNNLGLALVNEIVVAHYGRARCEDAGPDRATGSRMVIWFPRSVQPGQS
ncbi:MAG TPA: HAMP domain-containing sensor histidine kinase [Armatimonadota bacterium]|nr:HAMP domain-containing sensor histidine kinase [Armatimonadota bacterium]